MAVNCRCLRRTQSALVRRDRHMQQSAACQGQQTWVFAVVRQTSLDDNCLRFITILHNLRKVARSNYEIAGMYNVVMLDD